MGILRSLFGNREPPPPQAIMTAAVTAARAPLRPPVRVSGSPPEFVACADRPFFEILENYQHRSRPLHDYVSWDAEEEERLKKQRIEAYQLRNATAYKPHDVFHLWPYQPVDPEHVIKRVQVKKDAPKALPEFSHIMHVNVVSERVMKAITALEAGRHGFFPLEIVQPEGGPSYSYYFMQFLEHTDCTIPKLGGFRKGVRQDGTNYWVRTSTGDKVALDAERVGTRHLFHDKRAQSGCFISGELVAKLGDFLPRGYYLAGAGLVRKRSQA
jgi:Immunity protein family (Imm11)